MTGWGELLNPEDTVVIADTDEMGFIDGMRCEGGEPEYLVDYIDNAGCAQRKWWPAGSLVSFGNDDGESKPNDMTNVVRFERKAA